jgi:formamidopyrimidine-DNA glycosylase
MPELPEVETVKNSLKKELIGKRIIDVGVYYQKIIEYQTSDQFIKKIINQRINDLKRRGKWLVFVLDDYYLLSHLRMEGKYIFRDSSLKIGKHEHVSFSLDDNRQLRYQDTRKFGRMHLLEKDELYKKKPLCDLGLEPWDEKLTSQYLKEKYKNKKIPIKTVLLDQSIIVGIGNIYADEILFLSHINPYKKPNQLSDKELNSIIENTRSVLEQAIESGGTTIRSYESSEGVHGRFQQNLYVHNHEGDKCPKCKSNIVKDRIGGRSTYYCKKCQK